MKRKNPHIGSSFEDFLDEEHILEECTNTAIKRVIARQVEQAMKQQGLSKAAMARQMGTSRSALDRLLRSRKCFCYSWHVAACRFGGRGFGSISWMHEREEGDHCGDD